METIYGQNCLQKVVSQLHPTRWQYPLINYPDFYQTVDTKIVKQIPLMTSNDLIGIIGGTLGLFLGFSFFGCISVMLDYVGLLATKVTKSQAQDLVSGGKGNVRNLDSPDFETHRTSGPGRDIRTSPIQESMMTWIMHFILHFYCHFFHCLSKSKK